MSEKGDKVGETEGDKSKETNGELDDQNPATATEEPEKDGTGEQQGAKPRRFLTRASAANMMKAQAALTTIIRAMDPANYRIHMVMTGQLLDILDREYNEYVVKGGLDINKEPENSYMKEYRYKLQRAQTKHKTMLGILPATKEKAQPPHQPRTDFMPGEDDLLSSVSRSWSTNSKLSTGPSLLHKLKHMQSKINAKAEAVGKVVNHLLHCLCLGLDLTLHVFQLMQE